MAAAPLVHRGGPALAGWFATVLPETAHQPEFLAGLRDQARAHPVADAPQQPAPDPPAVPGPPDADLRLATYTPAHTRYGTHHNASVLVHLAVPPHPESSHDLPWRLRAVQGASPTRFQLQTEAFQGAGRPRVTVDENAARGILDLGGLNLAGAGERRLVRWSSRAAYPALRLA
ncbi:hypothetical protein [Streptomyces roseifaciens]|uniref:hypothetical protein n=1 Tax=Streptomyces roseifaciens TaxID=1488406 RepID=UPI000718316E|nr:hypothetical protein [Streptomyces roseifaciens]